MSAVPPLHRPTGDARESVLVGERGGGETADVLTEMSNKPFRVNFHFFSIAELYSYNCSWSVPKFSVAAGKERCKHVTNWEHPDVQMLLLFKPAEGQHTVHGFTILSSSGHLLSSFPKATLQAI